MANRKNRELLQLAFAGWIPDSDPDEITSDDWYTPPELIEVIDDWLGGIDLDPCAARHGGFVGARINYYDNGLTRPWIGNVEDVDIRSRFVNPPYSHPGPWLRELADLHAAYSDEAAGRSVALIRIDTSVWWWKIAWEADAICWLYSRVPFVRPGSTLRSQPRDHHALIFWGGEPAEITARWEWLGHVTTRECQGCRDRDASIRDLRIERGHELLSIDGISVDTYPFLSTKGLR